VPISASTAARTCGKPKGVPPLEGPSKASPLLTESGTSNCVPSSARRRRPRHQAPGVSGTASGPATCRNTVSSTSSPSRLLARHSDERLTRARSRLPGRPLVSMRITSSYDSWVNRRSASTKYPTSRAGSSRRRRSPRPCLATAASTSSGVNTFVKIPMRDRQPGPHPSTSWPTVRPAQKQPHWAELPPGLGRAGAAGAGKGREGGGPRAQTTWCSQRTGAPSPA